MKMASEKRHVVDFLFTLALFCVFAASALLVVIMGANVYKDTVDAMNENYENRTSLTYLAEKVRQYDTGGAVRLDAVGESPALVLRQQLEERVFETWIYVDEGYLKEILVAEGFDLKPSDGQVIKELASLKLEQDGALITMTTTDQTGKSESMSLFVRGGM